VGNCVQKINLNEFDVVVIQKQTTLERYSASNDGTGFQDFLSQDNQSKQMLYEASAIHSRSRQLLIDALDELNLSYIIINLDELRLNQPNFFSEESPFSGIRPKKGVVISLGGDGTFLHASHHVGNDIEILGINSCPQNSVGHLCVVKPESISFYLKKIFLEKNYKSVLAKRLKVKIANKVNIPLALNDILISHLHPAATSRYQISILDENKYVLQSEKHLSSGMWIATPAGSTAAISSYGFSPLPLNSKKILFANREPYLVQGEEKKLNKFEIDADTQSILIFSRMRQGLVCLDGPDFSVQFGFGDRIEVSSPAEASLLLIQ
jgi:NAD+ kinase